MNTQPEHPYTLASRTSHPANQYLPKSMSALSHGLTEETKHGHTTHGIVHAGLRGMRAFVARKKVSLNR